MDKKHYCINCMSEIEEGTEFCPDCGKKVGEYTLNQRALPPLTILNGKYLVGRVLGEGGFGITYLGLDLNLNMKVAIKEYFPIQFASRNAYESGSNDVIVIKGSTEELFKKGASRYEKEARRLVKLESLPGIVKIYNFFYENNTSYMIMEYVSGISLKEYLKSNRDHIDWKKALDLLKPVVESLSVLHKNGIIHRDISPDNIMWNEDGRITLIDFGSAREVDNTDKSLTIELKHGYAPPEQYQTHGVQGPWTDVYALCATLYQLISGTIPPSSMERLDKSTNLVPLSKYDSIIPKNVAESIYRGLDTDLKKRIQNMDELYNSLYLGRELTYVKRKRIKTIVAICASTVILVGLILGISKLIPKINEAVPSSELISDSADESRNSSFNEDDMYKEEDDDASAHTDEEVILDTASKYVKDNKLSYTDIEQISYSETDNGIIITGTDNNLTDIVIPDEINGKPVIGISGIGKNVTTLILPDSLILIDNSAFRNCVYLEYVFIPAGVSEIGAGAFDNCFSLNEIYISEDNSYYQVVDGEIVAK